LFDAESVRLFETLPVERESPASETVNSQRRLIHRFFHRSFARFEEEVKGRGPEYPVE
jgi:hypothetical protein